MKIQLTKSNLSMILFIYDQIVVFLSHQHVLFYLHFPKIPGETSGRTTVDSGTVWSDSLARNFLDSKCMKFVFLKSMYGISMMKYVNCHTRLSYVDGLLTKGSM